MKMSSKFTITILMTFILIIGINCQNIEEYKDKIRSMFYHAYDNYIYNAYPYDELKPITCTGFDTWGSYSLTLIDALDMFILLKNQTEFKRIVDLLEKNLNFDKDINVSVFETNIRVIGGLLSAHLLSYKLYESNETDEINVEKIDPKWPCDGPLLRIALKVADKLLPAFNTATGMPYGTVNLLNGVPKGETEETCVAGVGTFLLEFATLSRLSGNPIYENVALKAMDFLWNSRTSINLLGNHVNVQSGKWTAYDATIGSGVDSYFEYLVKGAILLNKKELLEQFNVYKEAIHKYLHHDDWYLWANMNKGHKTMPLFSSLDAYYPGLLAQVGEVDQARRTLYNYYYIWRQFGSLPEFYNVQSSSIHSNRETYPLRPELIESIMFLYRATSNDEYIEMAAEIVDAIENISRLDCGYATVKDVRDHKLENRMESFFLAETLKYLYLIFDVNNFLHRDDSPKLIKNHLGECLIETGLYVFNTEAHPIDGASLECCMKLNSNTTLNSLFDSIGLNKLLERYLELSNSKVIEPDNEVNTSPIDKCVIHNKANNISFTNSFVCNLNDKFKTEFYSIGNNKMLYT